MHVLPGGREPRRQTDGAIGYDVYTRAVVSPHGMDAVNPRLRKTLFDFGSIIDPSVADKIEMHTPEGKNAPELTYRLDVGKMVLCGTGFATAMPFPLCYLTLCRSGMAAKYNIVVSNGPGTIDPDYRGEAGIILENRGTKPFYVYSGMRIAQIIFMWVLIPRFNMVLDHEKLGTTRRNAGGFGSTGNH
jgi:dUTP pyrophosphatase